MQVPTDIRPDERVLILGIPPGEFLAALSRCVPSGMVVAIGEDDAVRLARKGAAALENVMLVPGSPDEIPWKDGFFTRVINVAGDWAEPERVRREIGRVSQRTEE